MKKKFKIGLFADGVWSHNLTDLINKDKNIKIVFICKRYKTKDYKIDQLAKKYKIKLIKFKNINSQKSLERLKQFDFDMFVSMSYDQIFKENVISLPRKKIINCHAGHLPKYRGRNVLNWALINGENFFYITIHYIDKNIDTGPILLRKKFKIKFNDTYYSILKKAEKYCPILLYKILKKIINKREIKIIYQSKKYLNKNYYRIRKPGDEFIYYNQKSIKIYNFVRALSHPNLYAKTYFKNKIIKIYRSKLIDAKIKYKDVKSGSILKVGQNYIDVKTSDNKIRLFFKKNITNFKVGECLREKP